MFFPFRSGPSAMIPLSRPAGMCGGVTPLAYLAAKLARAGEHGARSCLEGLGLPDSARIMWALSGHALNIAEVRQ